MLSTPATPLLAIAPLARDCAYGDRSARAGRGAAVASSSLGAPLVPRCASQSRTTPRRVHTPVTRIQSDAAPRPPNQVRLGLVSFKNLSVRSGSSRPEDSGNRQPEGDGFVRPESASGPLD